MQDILVRDEFLRIFTGSVDIDKTLPKYSNENIKVAESFNINDLRNYSAKEIVGCINEMHNKPCMCKFDGTVTSNIPDGDGIYREKNVLNKIKNWFTNSKSSKHERQYQKELYSNNKKKLDALKFFTNVKMTAKNGTEIYARRMEAMFVMLDKALKMGQTAIVDNLKEQLLLSRLESILYANNYLYRVTEEQIVDFVKRCEKGIRLDYVRNFTRLIPDAVLAKKIEADSLCVFDNYCVLYYDPDGFVYHKTEEEKEEERRKKADPILFGMIKGTRNLYYITDWIDDKCDLTFDKLVEMLKLSEDDIKLAEEVEVKL